jgi:hypothetical protein
MWNLATWLLGLPSTLLAAVNGSRRADHRGGDLRTPSPGSPTRLPRAADVPYSPDLTQLRLLADLTHG